MMVRVREFMVFFWVVLAWAVLVVWLLNKLVTWCFGVLVFVGFV
jgi:hypothetical protein